MKIFNVLTIKITFFIFSLQLFFSPSLSWAVAPIVRPYFSVRSSGMGGSIMTTGLYDENFFNNPARVTANPESKFTLLELSSEINTNTYAVASATKGGIQTVIQNNMGKNLHERAQFVLPAWYLAAIDDRRIAIGFGIVTGFQSDLLLSNSYISSGELIADVGPALTIGYKVLKDDSLSLGLTAHGSYRFSVDPGISVLSFLQGTSLGLSSLAGESANYNFDFGATYRFLQLGAWEFHLAAAAQNILGNTFNSIPLSLFHAGGSATTQPRTFGGGISIGRYEWGPFTNPVIALEIRDIGNNGNGSIYRLAHLGIETRWKSISLRAGLNQGYWTAGLGIDLYYLNLDLASYGEEIGLNAGTIEDRRYAATFGIHI